MENKFFVGQHLYFPLFGFSLFFEFKMCATSIYFQEWCIGLSL